jgi:hypothetical protein
LDQNQDNNDIAGNTRGKERLSTIDLLIMASCFIKVIY